MTNKYDYIRIWDIFIHSGMSSEWAWQCLCSGEKGVEVSLDLERESGRDEGGGALALAAGRSE